MQVDNEVTRTVGEVSILIMQLAPCGQVPIHLVHSLVQHNEGKLLLAEHLDERHAVGLVASVGTGGRSLVVHKGLAHHQDAGHECELRVTQEGDLHPLELALRGHGCCHGRS